MKLSVEREMRRAQSFAQKGDAAQAAESYRAILQAFPQNKRAQQGLASLNLVLVEDYLPRESYDRLAALFRDGDLAEMMLEGERLAINYPKDVVLQSMLGAAAAELGRPDEAIRYYRRVIELKPDYAEAHFNLANVLQDQGAPEEAAAAFRRALALKPGYAEAHYNLGTILQNDGASDQAAACYIRTLELKPGFAKAHNNLGTILQERDALDEALAHYRRAVELAPDYAEAHSNLGGILKERGALEEAAASYRRAVAARPDYVEAMNMLGVVLHGLGALHEAEASCQRALAISPDFADAHNTLGAVLQTRGVRGDAEARYRRAIELKPDYAEAYNNLAILQQDMGLLDEAVESCRRALEFKPGYAEAHNTLGVILQDKGALDQATASYRRALEIKPGYDVARAQKLHQEAYMCAWAALREEAEAVRSVGVEGSWASPFAMLVTDDDPARNRKRAERYVREKLARTALPLPPRPQAKPRRLRIGYFSADFRNHATMYLMARLFEVHDRSDFEIVAYSFGPDRQDEMRSRLVDAVDLFRDVREFGDEAVARLAREDRIDVAVDLKGHTKHSRPGIFAHRAAPVQIAYLGYPGTLGAEFMDYIVADETVIPPEHRQHYTESVITLPHSYQINDDRRRIAEPTPTRGELGLPDDAFVFCCFNASYKITPAEFDIWMRLLARVEGSVLWLLRSNAWAVANLSAEAEARGIDSSRVIFADGLDLEHHLARLRQADLFLDTFACNAHTTASDALWAGVPLVTNLGRGFAARVAGSLLRAVGLPELVTETAEDYAALALALATDRDRLAAVRQKLAENRTTAPLFDTRLTAGHLEEAYRQAYQRYFDGLEPGPISISTEAGNETSAERGGDAAAERQTASLANGMPLDRMRPLLELYQDGRLVEAAADAERLASDYPDSAAAHGFLASVRSGMRQPEAAAASYRRAIELKPDYAEAHYNLGIALRALGAAEEAAVSFERATALRPDYADAHYNLGLVQQRQGLLHEAVASFAAALAADPGHDGAREQKLHQLARMCDWAAIEDEAAAIATLGIEGPSVSPFSMLAMEDEPARHRLRSEKLCLEKHPSAALPALPRPAARPAKLRIGYFSADFRNHATMYLMARLLEVHDRERFEVLAYSYGPDVRDEMRQRAVAAVDLFRDVRELSDEAVAGLSREDGIDIAVDLKGYTQDARPGIFACRAAPVQIGYLGYPGTSGAPFMDYLVADETVIPDAERRHYSESLIRLPHSYQVNDDSRAVSERAMTRVDFGLPDDAFVFCCFNASYKIGPAEFAIWLRLLGEVNDGVLWLLHSNGWAAANLRRQAERHGIDGGRIVFADRLPHGEHLARYRLADLFLDTFRYNAHTTASDALWSGLPVVSRPGRGFAARVGASLLKAVGLPELIAESEAEYGALALALARDRKALAEVRRKLADNRTTAPLFDTKLFARHLEDAYLQAYQRWFEGKDPAEIRVLEQGAGRG